MTFSSKVDVFLFHENGAPLICQIQELDKLMIWPYIYKKKKGKKRKRKKNMLLKHVESIKVIFLFSFLLLYF